MPNLWLCAVLLATALFAEPASPKTVTIRDYIGVDWNEELVHQALTFEPGALTGRAAARVEVVGGQAIPSQVSEVERHDDGSVRSMKVWFFADVPANGAVTYRVTPGAAGSTGAGVVVRTLPDSIELATNAPKKIAIRLPAGGKEFVWPVPAREVPGPIQALRLPSGRTIGPGRFEVPFRVKSYRAELTAAGPLFAEARVHYVFDVGYWTFRARVLKNCAMVIVEEELDTGYSGQKWNQVDRFYSLVLNDRGFKPTQGWYTGRSGEAQFHDLMKERAQDLLTKETSGHIAASAGTKVNGYTLSFEKERDDYYLVPWPTWSFRVGTMARFVEPGGDAVGFAALNTMKWRNAMSLRFRADTAGKLSACLPLQVYEQGWPSEGYGRTSVHATGRTLFVPDSTARRHYGIMLSAAEDETESRIESLLHLSVKLGSHPLDVVKDWTLDWPDPLAKEKWAEETTEAGREALRLMRQWRDWKRTTGHFGLYSMWNHRALTSIRYGPVKAAIDSPGKLTAAERRELRRLCAYQAYVLNSLEHFPYGVGCHLGNPNMSIMAVDARVKAGLLVNDHPRFKKWGAWTTEFMKEFIRRYTFESGAPFENPQYTLGVTLPELAMANQVLLDNGLGDAFDTELFRRCIGFLFHWLTPPDPRFKGHRVILPLGNACYISMPPRTGRLLVEYYKDRDATLAGQLQWFANQTLPEDKQLRIVKEVQPQLGSAFYEDYGVSFRHGFGTPYETLFHIMAGRCNGHYEWETDQMTYTLYAKGQPIHLHFGNGPFPMLCRPWLRNRISFGRNVEPMERHDAETVAVAFTPEAEYTRAVRDIDLLRPVPTEFPLKGRGDMWSPEEHRNWNFPPPVQEIPLTHWHRQVLFVKDADPKGPNYFALRDGFGGTPTRPAELNLWFLANRMERRDEVFHYDGQCLVDMDVFVSTPQTFEAQSSEYAHIQRPYVRYTGFDPKFHPGGKLGEKQIALRIQQPAGKGYLVILYPRLKQDDPPATFTRLGKSAARVETTLSTDYLFLCPHLFTYKSETLRFQGMAGTVRRYKDGKITVTNGEGPAEFRVAGKTISGEGPFVATIEDGKVSTKTYHEKARVTAP